MNRSGRGRPAPRSGRDRLGSPTGRPRSGSHILQPTFVSGGIMESYPTTRFARLRHDLPGQQHITTTFKGAIATTGSRRTRPSATQHITTTFKGAIATADEALANNGVIAKIAASDPARAQLVTSRMQQLIAHNDAVM